MQTRSQLSITTDFEDQFLQTMAFEFQWNGLLNCVFINVIRINLYKELLDSFTRRSFLSMRMRLFRCGRDLFFLPGLNKTIEDRRHALHRVDTGHALAGLPVFLFPRCVEGGVFELVQGLERIDHAHEVFAAA